MEKSNHTSRLPFIVAGSIIILCILGAVALWVYLLNQSATESDSASRDTNDEKTTTEPLNTGDIYQIIGPKPKETKKLTFTFNTFPKVDSSTSNQHIITKAFCALTKYTCRTAEWEGEIFVSINEMEDIGYQKYEERIKLSKTHGAYMNLINKEVDLILVASKPSDEEMSVARQAGVKLELTPIAKDAFIFMNHTSNAIDSLSVDEIRQIYSGQTTNWQDLGGKEQDIKAYVRNANSGSQETMKDLVMKGDTLIEAEEMMIPSMMGLVSKLSDDPNGIGYSFFYYKNAMTSVPNVKLLKVNDILPTKDTIAAGEYPLTTHVYLAMRQQTELNSPAWALRSWYLSPEGQAVIDEVGYVPYFSD